MNPYIAEFGELLGSLIAKLPQDSRDYYCSALRYMQGGIETNQPHRLRDMADTVASLVDEYTTQGDKHGN